MDILVFNKDYSGQYEKLYIFIKNKAQELMTDTVL